VCKLSRAMTLTLGPIPGFDQMGLPVAAPCMCRLASLAPLTAPPASQGPAPKPLPHTPCPVVIESGMLALWLRLAGSLVSTCSLFALADLMGTQPRHKIVGRETLKNNLESRLPSAVWLA
jgi:hypothetical protein